MQLDRQGIQQLCKGGIRMPVNRCQVEILENTGFSGSSPVLYGPDEFNDMRGLPGANGATQLVA